MNRKLQVVLASYPLTTSKLVDLYYKEPNIKRLVDVMYRSVDYPEAKRVILDSIWQFEDLSRYDMNKLIEAAGLGKLSPLFQLLTWVSQEP